MLRYKKRTLLSLPSALEEAGVGQVAAVAVAASTRSSAVVLPYFCGRGKLGFSSTATTASTGGREIAMLPSTGCFSAST